MTRSLSKNLIKSYNQVSEEQEKRVIDSNAVLARKLEVLRDILTDTTTQDTEFDMVEGLNAENVSALLQDSDNETTVIKSKPAPSIDKEELLRQANEEIAQMKKEAMDEIESLRRDTIKSAHEEGYQNGYSEGEKKAKVLENTIKQKEEQLRQQEILLNHEYEKRIDDLEPLFVDKLIGIFNHVINIDVENYRDIILFLIDNTMKNMESGENLFVHVSKEDYPLVGMQKNRISERLTAGTTFEIIEDATLHKNECFIETEGGIFDCSLTTQMEELEKELRMLSYEGN